MKTGVAFSTENPVLHMVWHSIFAETKSDSPLPTDAGRQSCAHHSFKYCFISPQHTAHKLRSVYILVNYP
jgi:hypothetical protein